MIYKARDPSLKTLLLQEALKARGLYKGALDNWPGPGTEEAYQKYLKTFLFGDGTWSWYATVRGDDIILEDVQVTAFGGEEDTVDGVFHGATASGFNTSRNPTFMGCALPMRRDSSANLRGSPIPKLPWHTEVIFTDPQSGTSVATKLIDIGPAKWTNKAGDLTVAAARFFDPHATANNFSRRLDIRIRGGASHL